MDSIWVVDAVDKHCYHRFGMRSRRRPLGERIVENIRQFLRWFTPGLGVKRWFFVILMGTTAISIGLAFLLLDLYRNTTDDRFLTFISYISLIFLPRPLRALIFAGLGIGLVIIGILRLNRSILAPFIRPGRPVIDTLEHFRRIDRGPRVTVIGGGHGLATLLRGMKKFTRNLAAIVTVADDGGSSGRLRDSLGILPPGDIRNCLTALSSDEDLINQLFQYRYVGAGGELEGHSFGNLFISALSEITGSFEDAVAESGRVLSVYGRVLPSTLHDVRLIADKSLPHVRREVRVKGESHISEVTGEVRRLWLEPNNPPAFPAAVQALLQADMIVIGPGSLFTSILPNLLVPDIAAAIRTSKALKIFVCNATTQKGETDGYTCGDHISAIEDHIGPGFFDLIVSNGNSSGKLPEGVEWVEVNPELEAIYAVYQSDLADEENPGRHDPEKLAQVVIDLFMERTGPLVV
ncbi:MAG: uridine diphosphate-N-acetylglucosamine-binding protein YvcK [Anaerolineales bacterium]